MKKSEELWITNINRNQDISLGDLGITIRHGQSINLLKKKRNGWPHYNLTRKQIEDSIENGSIYKKSTSIKVRKVAPVIFNTRIDVAEALGRTSSRLLRKPTEIEVVDFPDLDLEEGSAEDFASENADMDFADRAPVLAVDPMFRKSDE